MSPGSTPAEPNIMSLNSLTRRPPRSAARCRAAKIPQFRQGPDRRVTHNLLQHRKLFDDRPGFCRYCSAASRGGARNAGRYRSRVAAGPAAGWSGLLRRAWGAMSGSRLSAVNDRLKRLKAKGRSAADHRRGLGGGPRARVPGLHPGRARRSEAGARVSRPMRKPRKCSNATTSPATIRTC